jgi:pimeloyl-ACP methyl ester carboxylesterase
MTHDLDHDVMVDDSAIAGFPARAAYPARPREGAPPVVFLHGAFADHSGFDGWLHRFARAGYPALAASRRGRLGVGPERAAGLDFRSYVDDTAAVLGTLDTAPVLVGHSLGGLLAQRLAEAGRARALILLASAPPGMLTAQAIAVPRLYPGHGHWLLQEPGWEAIADDALAWLSASLR